MFSVLCCFFYKKAGRSAYYLKLASGQNNVGFGLEKQKLKREKETESYKTDYRLLDLDESIDRVVLPPAVEHAALAAAAWFRVDDIFISHLGPWIRSSIY